MDDGERALWDEMQRDAAPRTVTCARCGSIGNDDEFMIEEGDEWECPPCWERCNAAERQPLRQPEKDHP